MTPKEKAQKLFDDFHYQICNDNKLSQCDSTEFCAKQCAAMAVNEIFSEFKDYPVPFGFEENFKLHYWGDVLKEIKNL